MIERDKTERTFSTPQVAGIIGRTVYKTIAYVRRGIIKPSIRDADGHGSRRIWSHLDVIRMAMICHLEDMGMTVPMMRIVGAEMNDKWMGRSICWLIYTTNDSDPPEIAKLVMAERLISALGDGGLSRISLPDGESQIVIQRYDETVESRAQLDPPHIQISMKYLHDWAAGRASE